MSLKIEIEFFSSSRKEEKVSLWQPQILESSSGYSGLSEWEFDEFWMQPHNKKTSAANERILNRVDIVVAGGGDNLTSYTLLTFPSHSDVSSAVFPPLCFCFYHFFMRTRISRIRRCDHTHNTVLSSCWKSFGTFTTSAVMWREARLNSAMEKSRNT